ncbi:hypothetical protein ACTXT7_007368 [Hymenolepis weldensis]
MLIIRTKTSFSHLKAEQAPFRESELHFITSGPKYIYCFYRHSFGWTRTESDANIKEDILI